MAFLTEAERAKPFSHTCRGGVVFYCGRTDLSGFISVELMDKQARPSKTVLVQATAEFIGWWAANIYPRLNGFQGFDTLRFQIQWK